jgi:hypothetical protein
VANGLRTVAGADAPTKSRAGRANSEFQSDALPEIGKCPRVLLLTPPMIEAERARPARRLHVKFS